VVIWPFLPGDSLLFAAGAIAAREGSALSLPVILVLVAVAAFLGDTVNYWVGRWIGPRVLDRDGRIFKRKYLEKTRGFYDKYGAKTIVLARFVPIVRTFAPFVAGVGSMHYPRFLFYNVTGGALWTILLTGAGYLFGGLPLVRDNFSAVIMAIIVISILPMAVEYLRARSRNAKEAREALAAGAEAPEAPGAALDAKASADPSKGGPDAADPSVADALEDGKKATEDASAPDGPDTGADGQAAGDSPGPPESPKTVDS
jgi:membrane-associated protein